MDKISSVQDVLDTLNKNEISGLSVRMTPFGRVAVQFNFNDREPIYLYKSLSLEAAMSGKTEIVDGVVDVYRPVVVDL